MAKNQLPTEEELLANGTVVAPIGGAPTAISGGAVPTEADLMAQGRQVAPAGPAATAAPRRTFGEELVRQTGLSVRYPLQAAGSLLDIVGAPIAATLNTAFPGQGGQPRFQTPGQSINRLLTAGGLPTPETPLERTVGSMTQRGYETMGPAGLAKQISNTARSMVTRNTAQQIAANPGALTVASTAGAGGGQVAREFGVSEPVATAIDLGLGLGANAATQRLSNAIDNRLTPEGQRAMDLAAKARAEGVRLSAGDLGSRAAQRIESLSQDLPFSGRDAIMRKTGEQIKDAISRLDRDVDLGSPTGKVMVDSLRNQYQLVKGVAASNYNKVSPLLDQVPGSSRVPMPEFSKQVQVFLKEFPDYLKSPDIPQSTKDLLQSLAQNRGAATNIGAQYDSAREISKAIGQAVSQARRQAQTTGSEVMASRLEKVYGSLKDDFGAWATKLQGTNPTAAKAFADADAYFKQAVLPFRSNSTIYKTVSKGTTQEDLDLLSDTIMKKLLRPDQPELGGLAARLGGAQGQKASEAEIIQRATRAGLDARLASEVSPARFVNTLNMQDPLTQRILSQNAPLMQRAQNLSDISQAGRGSVAAMTATPRTGVTMKGMTAAAALASPIAGAPVVGALGTGLGLGAANLANRGLLTQPGQRLMFAQPADPLSYSIPSLLSILPNTGQ